MVVWVLHSVRATKGYGNNSNLGEAWMRSVFEAGLGENSPHYDENLDLVGLVVAKNEAAFSRLVEMTGAQIYEHDEYDLMTQDLVDPTRPESVKPSLIATLAIKYGELKLIRTVYLEKNLRKDGIPKFRPEKYQSSFQTVIEERGE